MAYTNFTLLQLEEEFGLTSQRVSLFETIESVSPSSWLLETLSRSQKLLIRSEKARSELLISPILLEVQNINQDVLTIHSGDRMEGDKKRGLTGECDFILAKNTGSLTINTPIISVVEAKRQDIDLGIDQCAAQMLGSRFFNERRGTPLKTIYGCSTTAVEWVFLKLENNVLYVDNQIYFSNNLGLIIGVFQHIVNQYKSSIK